MDRHWGFPSDPVILVLLATRARGGLDSRESDPAMTDRLATHLTTWKAWYAVAAPIALIAGSWVSLFPGLAPVEDEATRTLVNGLLVPVQFIAFGLLSMLFIALPARRWPTTRDLALTRGLTGRDAVVLVVVFVVSHALFWLLSRTTDPDPGQARRYFEEMNVSGSLTVAVASTVAGVILAPVCEELLYRGAILRPIHDHLARHGRAGLGAAAGILVASGAFALPHLGGSLTGAVAASYLVTGVAFGLVYVLTGSMTAAMVSHSLQSCFAFGQILLFGRGDDPVSPIIYVLVFGCPLWTYLCARGLYAIFPKGRATAM